MFVCHSDFICSDRDQDVIDENRVLDDLSNGEADANEDLQDEVDQILWNKIKAKRVFERNVGNNVEIEGKHIESIIDQSSTQFVVQTLRNQAAKESLKREQLLCLVQTGIRTWHFVTNKLEGGEEDAQEVQEIVVSILSKLKQSRWFDMTASELKIVQHLVKEIHNITFFMGNIMEDLLQKTNNANANIAESTDKAINIDQIETKIDSIVNKLDLLPSLSVRENQMDRITLKLGMISKALEIRKAAENLEATVNDLKP